MLALLPAKTGLEGDLAMQGLFLNKLLKRLNDVIGSLDMA
jgi:hypothetical protein